MTLTSAPTPSVTLRPLRRSDVGAWRSARQRNAAWLVRWDATAPPGSPPRPVTFRTLVRRLAAAGPPGHDAAVRRRGRRPASPASSTVNNIVRGSAQFASIGYWLDQDFAGRGVMPRAVAMAVDHCFQVAGLHRIEVAIRPENSNSLRVVEKLGLHEVGYAPRFLHIDGDWRDHRSTPSPRRRCRSASCAASRLTRRRSRDAATRSGRR